MTPAQKVNFERLIKPKHIAFVGGVDAEIAIGEAKRAGFKGLIWPVNPRREELGGHKCFQALEDLPSSPDAVYLAIPRDPALKAVKDLAKLGAGGIVCYTAGFGEADSEGEEAEKLLVEYAGDMALIGPNCYGIINYIDKVALWPFAHGGSCPGYGAAIITQSGMFSSDITMSQRSLPLSYMVSAGNQAVMGLADFIDILCEKPEVRAIGLHIEGLSDVSLFEKAALKALRLNKPVVALKTGTSKIGSTLTLSHTGSLSGSKELYEALFKRTGVISVNNPSQFLETLKYLCVSGCPKQENMIGFTCSGGGATMLADKAEDIGLKFPKFNKEKSEKLVGLLPEIATLSNPLDYTTPIWGQPEKTKPVFQEAMNQVLAQSAILVQDYPVKGLDESLVYYRNDALAFAQAAADNNLPAAICSTIPENFDRETRDLLVSLGVSPMQGIHEALNAISHAATWNKNRTHILEKKLDSVFEVVANLDRLRVLDEYESKVLLKKNGFNVPQGKLCLDELNSNDSESLNFPIALKMVSSKILHKTELNAVVLNVKSDLELRAAVTKMRSSVSKKAPNLVSNRYLIEEMANTPLAELIVGIRSDPQFGLSLTIGSGGILVDLIGDVSTIVLPTHSGEIREAIKHLKVFKLLDGFRGKPKVKLEVVVDVIMKLVIFAEENINLISEIEINPMFVYKDSVLMVDALISTFDTDDT
ncbi:MAG: acetate--CoA ligase family protein [Paracoccaceae bacterium]|nr:acetate--CoA ligase family protein [Paracoccaceae bacterium]